MISNYIKHNNFRKPNWLKVNILFEKKYKKVEKIVKKYNLNTICKSGNCPNISECWGRGTATFMILGNTCTRSCAFCAVETGNPKKYDINEPKRILNAINIMNVRHAVIASVNRDDLHDKGSSIWYSTIKKIKKEYPDTTIETLIPDIKYTWDNLYKIISLGQDLVSHNMETVERLYKKIKPQSKYFRNLEQIKRIKLYGKKTKSGIMLGLGEKDFEIYDLISDLVDHGLDILTVGQYLKPSDSHLDVFKYVNPDRFNSIKEKGLKMGLKYVESGPLVRSSYFSEKHILQE